MHFHHLPDLSHRRRALILLFLVSAAGYLLFASWSWTESDPSLRPDPSQSSVTPPSRLIQLLYPALPESLEAEESPWKTHTRNALRALFACLDRNDCTQNQEKGGSFAMTTAPSADNTLEVIIVESTYFLANMIGHIGGEEIWANSTMLAMKNLGYTVLYAKEDMAETAQLCSMVPDLVKMVIVNDWHALECWKDTARCLQTSQNPTGIPAHKMFSFYFWPFPNHPLGPKWVLSPEPYALEPGMNMNTSNTYLGYSIEHACALTPFIPASERPPGQAWILAKRLDYLAPEKEPAWSTADYDAATEASRVRYALGAGLAEWETGAGAKEEGELQLPSEYVNHGRLEKGHFVQQLAQSRVLIGIGNPIVSPTPWDALCLGVPFINPLDRWDEADPEDSTKWHGQHAFISMLGKPYVYSVRRGDRAGFVQAIQEALSNPIARYIPERMKMAEVERRLEEIVDHDWAEEERTQAQWCHEPCGCATPCNL
ncbi:hypothetical protein C8R46DRAFT_1211303 [Mycena filopes]|nr:hypothetical protein C8R46DRAFT_1211303 [Mycena filopes]